MFDVVGSEATSESIIRLHRFVSNRYYLILGVVQAADCFIFVFFVDSKIALYSPSESAKVYEKSLNRKNNSRFHPKAALHKLQKDTNSEAILDEKAKRELIAEYLEVFSRTNCHILWLSNSYTHYFIVFQFKQLIISLDRDEEDEEDKKSLPAAKVNNVYSAANTGNIEYTIKNESIPSSSTTPATPVYNSIHPNQPGSSASTPGSVATPNNSFTPNLQVCNHYLTDK